MYNDLTEGNGGNTSEPSGADTRIVTRLSSDKVIFVTPEAGKLDDVNAYDVIDGMQLNYFYSNEIYFKPAEYHKGITNFSAYTFAMTEVPMIDVMLLRGSGAVADTIGQNNVALNVISHITEAANEEGLIVPKLYQNDTAIGVLGETVSYIVNGTAKKYGAESTEGLTIDDLTAALQPGDVIQINKDGRGNIVVLSVISRYDYTNKAIVPVFNTDGRYINVSSMYNTAYNNYIVGEVKGIDRESGILSFTAGTTNQVADIASAPVVYVFDADKQKVRTGSLDDIQIGDEITMRTWQCFYAKEVVVFRSSANSGI